MLECVRIARARRRRWSMADAVGSVSASGSGPSERAGPVDDVGGSTPPRDVFSSAEFDAVDFLNRLFPDETSLTGVDALVAKLRLRVRRVDDEILEAVRSQSTGGVRAKADLAQAQTAILELGARIRDIKDKAEVSETMVQEICRDIKKLDRAKRHLTGTITALRRLSMLVSAVDQLETMAMRRQYRDSANLLEAVNQLSAHFDGYNDIPKVAELQRKYAKIRAALRANVFEDFHATWQPSVIEQDPGAAPRLADACLVVNALEPHVREELVGNLTNKELTAYAQVFDGSFGEQSNLDAVERRYAWIKRNLKTKEEMWGVFPPHWRVPQLLCMSLCKLTRTHLLEMLDAPGPKEVQTTLQALHRTIEFERDMDDYFQVDAGADKGADEDADFDAEDGASAGQVRAKYERLAKEAEVAKQRGGRALPMDSAAAALANASFKGVIASSFEDHMGPYVELEERQLMEFLDALVAEETWGRRADATTGASSASSSTSSRAISNAARAPDATHGEVLASAGQVFLNIKKVFRRCSNLTRGKALFALHGVFSRVIRSYAGKLIDRVELSGKILSDVRGKRDEGEIAGEYRCLCLVINTAEWCKDTVGPLGESMRRMLDGNLGDGVDSEATEEEFASLITAAVATLVSGAEARTELISGVTKVNWGALEVVGDQSAYVDKCNAALFAVAPAVRATVSADYHRFFCEKLAGTLAPKLYRAVFKCRRFSDTGAQQLLLDIHAIKTTLNDLPVMGEGSGASTAPASHSRLVAREMGACEALMKVVLSPTEGLAETFKALLPGGSAADFRAVCELKGMKKTEAAAAADGIGPRHIGGGLGAGGGADTRTTGAAAASGEGFSSPSKTRPPAPPRTTTAKAAASSNIAAMGASSSGGSAGGAAAAGTQHKRTGSGGLAGMSGMGSLGMNKMFRGMGEGMFKTGSGSSINHMMEKAKEATQKAAVGMKEMGEKAADETRRLGKRF